MLWRMIRVVVDQILVGMSGRFDKLYAEVGRPLVSPERLLRALLLQIFYLVRSERMLMQRLDYNLLFRWFVGVDVDEPVRNHAVFSKNRERLLSGAAPLERALQRGRDADRSVGLAEEFSTQGRRRVRRS